MKRRGVKTSRYRGVFWDSTHKKWSAKIMVEKRQIWLGFSETEEAAAALYRDALVKYRLVPA